MWCLPERWRTCQASHQRADTCNNKEPLKSMHWRFRIINILNHFFFSDLTSFYFFIPDSMHYFPFCAVHDGKVFFATFPSIVCIGE